MVICMKSKEKEIPFLEEKNREKAIPIALIYGVVGMLIILLIASLSLTFKKEYALRYTEHSDLDYNVYLKSNNFYGTKFLPKDKNYISTLIEYIDADFSYDFTSEENIDLDYSYYIKATLLVDTATGKNIYKKEDMILEKQSFSKENNTKFDISENVKIDYDRYNNIASNFINQYDINANSKVVVALYVDVDGKHSDFDKSISDKAVVSLEIPLTNKTVDINMNYELSNDVNAILQYRSTRISHPVLFTVSIILAVLDVVAIVAIIYYVVSNRDNKVLYSKKLNKILRDYNKYLSQVIGTGDAEELIHTKTMEIENVMDFDDLINIRDILEKPILYRETIPNKETVFYIIENNICYLYTMRVENMKNKNCK